MAKVAFTFWISSLLIFYIPLPEQLPDTPILLLFAIMLEFITGALMGFMTELFVIALAFAGSLMDTQAGLSVASLLDPATGSPTTLLSKLMNQLGLLLFLLLNGHHMVMSLMVNSFRALPVAYSMNLYDSILYLLNASVKIFSIGVRFAAPILLIVFIIDFGFGMLSRVAPQINVFQLGFQVKPILSLFVLLLIGPGMVDLMNLLLDDIVQDTMNLLFLFRA